MKQYLPILGIWLALACSTAAAAQDSTAAEPIAAPAKKTSFLSELYNPKLAEAVMQWVGTPYRMGGCTPQGIDCSCLVRSIVSAAYGIELSRSSRSMIHDVARLGKKGDFQEGDLLFFRRGKRISHVGIYLRDGWYVHASTREGVVIRRLDTKSRRLAFYCAGRIKTLPSPAVEK